jgi:hypothetical protein
MFGCGYGLHVVVRMRVVVLPKEGRLRTRSRLFGHRQRLHWHLEREDVPELAEVAAGTYQVLLSSHDKEVVLLLKISVPVVGLVVVERT